MKKQWQSMTETQIKNFSVYRECSQLISECGCGWLVWVWLANVAVVG